jgi:hypothetical protein
VAHTGEIRNTYKILGRLPEGKRSLGKPRHTQEDNIKIDLKYDMGAWTGFILLRAVTSGRFV